MKALTKTITLLASATAFAFSSLSAQVSTSPVGYVSVTLNGGSDTFIGAPLQRSTTAQGLVSSVSLGVVTFSGSPAWSNDQFVAGEPHFLLIASGNQEGDAFPILSNDSNSVTVDLGGRSLASVAAGTDDAAIVPYWTPSSLMPADLPPGTKLFLYDNSLGINKAASSILSYNGSNWFNGLSNADDFLIHPYESVVCRLPDGASDVTIAISGGVPMAKHRLVFDNQGVETDFRIYYNGPVEVTLGNSGLGFTAGDKLLAFDNSIDGINKAASQVLSYNGTNWFNGLSLANDFVLEPGKGYIFRMSANGSVTATWENLQGYLQ